MDRRRHLIPAAIAALALTAPAALAALPGGARYAGTTSDGSAVTLKLAGDAKSVKRMRIHYDLSCNKGRSAHTYTDITGPRVHKDRTFSVSGKYTGTKDGSKNTFHVSGKLTAGKAHGKFSLKSTGRASDGSKLSCTTGKVTWSATRQN
jgi:hypothetical protein